MLVFTYVVTRFTHKTKRNHSIFVPSRREKENQSKCSPHHQPNRSPFCIERKKREKQSLFGAARACILLPSRIVPSFFLFLVVKAYGGMEKNRRFARLFCCCCCFWKGKEEKHLLIIQCSFRSLVKVTPRSGFIPYTPSPCHNHKIVREQDDLHWITNPLEIPEMHETYSINYHARSSVLYWL